MDLIGTVGGLLSTIVVLVLTLIVTAGQHDVVSVFLLVLLWVKHNQTWTRRMLSKKSKWNLTFRCSREASKLSEVVTFEVFKTFLALQYLYSFCNELCSPLSEQGLAILGPAFCPYLHSCIKNLGFTKYHVASSYCCLWEIL